MAVFHSAFTAFSQKCVMIQVNGAEQLKGGLVMYRILVVDDEAKIRLLSANTRSLRAAGDGSGKRHGGGAPVPQNARCVRYCHHGCDDAGA